MSGRTAPSVMGAPVALLAVALALVLEAACAASPAPAPAPAPAPRDAPTTAPVLAPVADAGGARADDPPDAAACTMTRAFVGTCKACVTAHCCQPPLAFSVPTSMALGCPLGCRKSSPTTGPDAPAVLKRCLDQCQQIFPDPSGDAARFGGCLAIACQPECLTDPAPGFPPPP